MGFHDKSADKSFNTSQYFDVNIVKARTIVTDKVMIYTKSRQTRFKRLGFLPQSVFEAPETDFGVYFSNHGTLRNFTLLLEWLVLLSPQMAPYVSVCCLIYITMIN